VLDVRGVNAESALRISCDPDVSAALICAVPGCRTRVWRGVRELQRPRRSGPPFSSVRRRVVVLEAGAGRRRVVPAACDRGAGGRVSAAG